MSEYSQIERSLDHERFTKLVEIFTRSYKTGRSNEWVEKYLELIELEAREMRLNLTGEKGAE